MVRALLIALLSVFFHCCAPSQPLPLRSAGNLAMEDAMRDLCRREVALLGETGGHGDGRTIEFKAALVPRLVQECGFGAVFIEGSSYDFLELERRGRRGEAVTRAMVSSAVGGLWNRYAEMQPLITFLHDRLASGRLRLGGIDDQLGSAGAFYSIKAMPEELSAFLPKAREGECREIFRRAIYGQTGSSESERAPLSACLFEIRAAVLAGPAAEQAERLHLIANIRRYAGRNPSDGAEYMPGRDRSMWLNFQWLRARLPRGSKIIVWGATSHLARDATAYELFSGGGNLGAYVAREYADRAFFLAFAASAGTYRWGGGVRTLTADQAGSLEAEALSSSSADPVYLDKARLRRLGRRPAGIFTHEPALASWSEAVDGVVVFREERAPQMAVPASR